jgi:nicotinate-nucleotide adenylyltransferase
LGDFDPSAPVTISEPAPRRIGVLGGTFDPVHIGHLRGALEVAETLALDELRLTPSARPPHRDKPQVSAKDRLAMVECAVAGVAPLVVDARELQRDKPSYTIDTLELMRAELAVSDQVFLLLGWDAFCGLPTWHRWEELLQHCHILVLQRPDADSEPPDALRNRYPPPRSVNCWPAVSRYVSWCPTRSWPTSMRTDSTVRRTEWECLKARGNNVY